MKSIDLEQNLNQSNFFISQNILSDLKRQKGNISCTMDDVWRGHTAQYQLQ